MKRLLGVSLFACLLGSAFADPTKVICTDKDFAGFPRGNSKTFPWQINETGEATATIVDEAPTKEGDKRSLRLLDPDLEETFNPLDASWLVSPLKWDASARGIVIAFDFRMANVGANTNLLFRVYGEQANTRDFVGAIQFYNNWDGESGGVRIGPASGTDSGKLEFDRWYRVVVKLPLPGVEGTQSFTVTDLEDPEQVFSFDEKIEMPLEEYARLSFASGFGDKRKLDAMISNVSISSTP